MLNLFHITVRGSQFFNCYFTLSIFCIGLIAHIYMKFLTTHLIFFLKQKEVYLEGTRDIRTHQHNGRSTYGTTKKTKSNNHTTPKQSKSCTTQQNLTKKHQTHNAI